MGYKSQYKQDKLPIVAIVSAYTFLILFNNASQGHKTCSLVKRLMTLEEIVPVICLSNGGIMLKHSAACCILKIKCANEPTER